MFTREFSMKDLRSFIKKIEDEGELARVREEVDPRFEAAAVLKRLDEQRGPAVMFEKVKGFKVPAVGNLCGTRSRLAKAIGVKEQEAIFRYMEALEKPRPCKLVAGGPVKESVESGKIEVGRVLPVLTHHEKDAGPYITSGVLIYKNPETGVRAESIHRLQVKGDIKLGVFIASMPLLSYYSRAEASKRPLEVAVAIGLEPALMLASVAEVPVGFDKFDLASSLRGGDLDLVKCEAVDVEVPSSAEFVVEGEFSLGVYEEEGPFGETSGYYVKAKSPFITVKAITHREKPIYQAILPESMDAVNLIALPTEASIYRAVRNIVPTVVNVCMTSFLHAVISIRKRYDWEPNSAILPALLCFHIKHVVVVDEDVNIFNPREVEWAIATRVQGDRGIMVFRGLPGTKIDPSSDDGLTAKMGVDATKPLDAPPKRFEKIRIPGEEKIRIEDYK